MKKLIIATVSLFAILGALGAVDAVAAAYPPALGGTGTAIAPLPGQVLIGTNANVYTPAYILCAGTCAVATSSGGITITGTGIANNTGNWAGTWQLFNPSDFLASSTQKVISVNGLSGVVTITSSSLGVVWPTVNGNQATNYNLVAGQGATSTVSGATTTISVSLNNGSAVTCSANQFLNTISATGTAACATITFPTAMTYTFVGGTGVSVSQATSSSNTTTTYTLNINNGSGSTCGAQYANGISATGTVSCGTPSGAGGVATSGAPVANDVTYFSPDGNTVTGSSSLTYNGTTFTITNSSTTAANTLNIITNVNTGSGASTNGAVFINCSQDTAGLCENINQESSNLSSAQNMLFVNSGSPDNTTVSSTQTLTSTSTALTVGSTAGFPSSGDLLIQQSTSSSQNANGTILQYSTTTATQFIGTAGSFYQPLNSNFNLVTGDKVYYVDTNDHQVKVEIYQHGINGAATPLKIVGTGNLGLEWTNQGLNNASGSGQFQLDLANSVGQNPTSSDVMHGEGRNDANSAFNPVWAFTRPGLTDEGMFCIGDCNNLVTPQSWNGLLNLFPNSAEGDTNVAALPIINIQESDLGLTANAFQLKNNSGTIIMDIDGSGNVSTTGQYYENGVPLPTSTAINGVTGPTFTFSIVNTSTASSITTSSAQLFLNLLQYASGTDINVSANGVINFVNTPGYITTSTYNASTSIATTAPITGGGSIVNNGTLTLGCATCVTTTTGNWQGTWQNATSGTYYLSSNPNGYISTAPTSTINGAAAPFTFSIATTTTTGPTITTSTSGGSSTVAFTVPDLLTLSTTTLNSPPALNTSGAVNIVQNTTTMTSVYSYTIPAGTMCTTCSLQLNLSGTFEQDVSGQTISPFTLNILFGGLSIASASLQSTSAASQIGAWAATATITNVSSTGTNQIGAFYVNGQKGASFLTANADGFGTVNTANNASVTVELANPTSTATIMATLNNVVLTMLGGNSTTTIATGGTYK